MRSKVWREGRWFWSCTWENGASVFDDLEVCRAMSKGTYSTEAEARAAGSRHSRKENHRVFITKVGKRIK